MRPPMATAPRADRAELGRQPGRIDHGVSVRADDQPAGPADGPQACRGGVHAHAARGSHAAAGALEQMQRQLWVPGRG